MKITLNGESNLELVKSLYSNKRVALEAIADDGLFARLTVNMPEQHIEDDEVIIKNWSENEGMLEQLIEQKIVSEPVRWISANFVIASVCKLLI